MSHHRLPPILILAALSLSLSIAPRASEADPTPPTDAGPPLPRFDAEPFADDKTPLPRPEEWRPTTPATLTSSSLGHCRTYRLREWVKIRCSEISAASIALLGGSTEGVHFFIDRPRWEGGIPMGGEMVFPVRRGDARVFEWSVFGDSYEGVGAPESGFLVSESWAADEPGPVIIAQ